MSQNRTLLNTWRSFAGWHGQGKRLHPNGFRWRSGFRQPHGEVMVNAPLDYQLHALIGMVLFTLWPFTRLVHVFSAPVVYLFRPYIVYRSREAAGKGELVGTAPRRRGW